VPTACSTAFLNASFTALSLAIAVLFSITTAMPSAETLIKSVFYWRGKSGRWGEG